jgi:hypothetical protein
MNNPAIPPEGLRLSEVLPYFTSLGYVIPSYINYGHLWRAVVSGQVPSVRAGRQYRLHKRGMDVAAEHLNLISPTQPVSLRNRLRGGGLT